MARRRSESTSKAQVHRFPRWGFSILAAGGFWASGLYAGMIRAGGTSAGDIAGAIGFGLLGAVMVRGAIGARR
jgi:hypothetical protein